MDIKVKKLLQYVATNCKSGDDDLDFHEMVRMLGSAIDSLMLMGIENEMPEATLQENIDLLLKNFKSIKLKLSANAVNNV